MDAKSILKNSLDNSSYRNRVSNKEGTGYVYERYETDDLQDLRDAHTAEQTRHLRTIKGCMVFITTLICIGVAAQIVLAFL